MTTPRKRTAADVDLVVRYSGPQNGPRAMSVETVSPFGHIVIHSTGDPSKDVVFADLGGSLHLWSWQGCQLDPGMAEELATQLKAWAKRARKRS